MLKAKIEILDEVNIHVKGLDPETLKLCREEVDFYVPNHRNMPRFKQGWWNGKICLMTATGRTKLGLLPDIIPIIERKGYRIELTDHRKDWSHVSSQLQLVDENHHQGFFWTETQQPIILRDYQIEGINTALQAGSGVLEMATGSGKSLVAGTLAKIYSQFGNVVVIVPNINLALQTRATFRQIGIAAGIWYGQEHDRQTVTLSTWQSLDHFEELLDGVVAVIVDEAQGAKGKTLEEILSGPAKHIPFRFGCSGSLPEPLLFRKQIIGSLGPTIFDLPTWKLQEKGVLAEAQIHQIEIDDFSNKTWKRFRKNPDLTWQEEVMWMFREPKRTQLMASLIEEIAKSGTTLVLVAFKEVGKILENAIPESIYIDGDVKAKVREQIFTDFNKTDKGVLIGTSGVASVGIDIPTLRNVVIAEIGKNSVRILQSLGRGVRKGGEKTVLDFWDFCSNDGYSSSQAKKRQAVYRKAKQPFEITKIGY